MLICEYNGSERANFLGTGDKTAGAQNHQTPQLPNPTSRESSRKTDQLFLSPVKTLSLSLPLRFFISRDKVLALCFYFIDQK